MARPYARSRPAASSSGISAASSVASATEPGTRAVSSIGRTSGMPSQGGTPIWPIAARAWRVSPSACRIASGSVNGSVAIASSRPIGVRASRARSASTCGHSRPPLPAESLNAGLMRAGPSAAFHEVERQVGRLVAGRGDRLLLLGKERREHVIGDAIPVLSGPARPADADLDAAEVVGAKGRDQGADPVVATRAARETHAHLAQREIEIVEDDDQVGGAQVELAGEPRHRGAGDVHEAARLDEVERLALPAAGGDRVTAVALEARMNAMGQRVDDALAHVVPGVAIFRARIPQADDGLGHLLLLLAALVLRVALGCCFPLLGLAL